MLNHGISTGALFFCVGMLYDRRHTFVIAEYGGLKSVMPWFSSLFLLVCLSSLAVPGLNGFVGEFLIMLGSWPLSHSMVALASLGVVVAAGYILWMVQRVLYGEVTHAVNRSLPDLSPREFTVLIPLVVLAIVMGVASPLFTSSSSPRCRASSPRPTRACTARRRRPRRRPCSRAAAGGGRDPGRPRSPPALPGHRGGDHRRRRPARSGLHAQGGRAPPPPSRWPFWPALATVIVIANGSGAGPCSQQCAADDFSLFFQGLILAVRDRGRALSPSYLRETGIDRGEYYALVLFAIVGMLGLVSALELVAVFVALEIMSVALYALAGLHRDRAESQEAALKYFITGSFSSAFFLYGVALLYGLTGHTSMALIAQGLRTGVVAPAAAGVPVGAATALALVGTALLLVGFGFKVAAVPFHMWAPDAYEGAPTTVTALMAAGVKAAAFGAFLRVFVQALPSLAAHWQPAVAVLAIVTMVVGNFGALAQSNLKRMLAYSSVAHAGYLMTALVAAPGLGTEAILFYLVTYAAVNLGGFGAFAVLARSGREPVTLGDMAGLSERRPLLAAALTVFLVSLTGVPISGGFVGKFYLFSAAVRGLRPPRDHRHAHERRVRVLLPAGRGRHVHGRPGR
jgi:NADH-quinone oxidoreductase subunit N